MGVPLVQGCCFCFNLSTGSKILGSLSLFGAIVGVFLQIVLLAALGSKDIGVEMPGIVWMMSILAIGVLVLVGITSAMLIYGASERRKGFVKPYLVMTGVSILFSVVNSLTKQNTGEHPESPSGGIIEVIIVTALKIYFWICVYSFYHELCEEEKTKNSQPESNVAVSSPNHAEVTYAPVAK